jgi:anion-transporting  ArsA/GET3 family ATPase
MEFIIATIPTYLGVNESGRLLRALRKDGIPVKRIVVNQVCRRCTLMRPGGLKALR